MTLGYLHSSLTVFRTVFCSPPLLRALDYFSLTLGALSSRPLLESQELLVSRARIIRQLWHMCRSRTPARTTGLSQSTPALPTWPWPSLSPLPTPRSTRCPCPSPRRRPGLSRHGRRHIWSRHTSYAPSTLLPLYRPRLASLSRTSFEPRCLSDRLPVEPLATHRDPRQRLFPLQSRPGTDPSRAARFKATNVKRPRHACRLKACTESLHTRGTGILCTREARST